jgi:4-alpha-glucanotransferase
MPGLRPAKRHNGDVHDAWGITDGYHDLDGTWHPTSDAIRERLRAAMGDIGDVPPLWFVLEGTTHRLWNQCELVLESGESWGVIDEFGGDVPLGYHRLVPVDGGPVTQLIVHPRTCPTAPSGWGAAAQIYALWTERSWGIGDLRDLRRLAERLVGVGASALLMSPLHQPAPTLPQEPSPYYPSSRRTRNPMLLGLDVPPPAHLRCAPDRLINHDTVWIAKRAVLEAEFDAVPSPPEPGPIAIWNARCDVLRDAPANWVEPLPDPSADADLLHRAQFHEWLQLRIDEQLAAVAATGISLIGDLAVGFSPDGADAYEFRNQLADGIRIGAPPDPFNADGQNWGIPPFVPWRLRAAGYRPFIDTIRAALRGVAGLRVDHVMGLFRQFWIPEGEGGAGAYVRFPADELLAIVCLEATRAGAFVIGEDLGTVEPQVRAMLAERNIIGTKVLWFEAHPPALWPDAALATVTTHDLPTITAVYARPAGDPERGRLVAVAPLATTATEAITAAHHALLQSPARLRLITTDDLAGAARQPNLPGTNDYPSWRIPLPVPVDDLV